MEMANFSNVIRTLFYIIAFYYIFRFVARLLFPILVRKAVEHAQDSMQQQFSQAREAYRKDEGEVTIDTSKAAPARPSKKVGEYIDYEEIQ